MPVMQLPKRIRLLKVVQSHLYGEVKTTLATDKEIRSLKDMNRRLENYYVKQTTH
jgi:hypothetical protein